MPLKMPLVACLLIVTSGSMQARSVMAQRGVRALLVDTGSSELGFISERDFLRRSHNKNWRRTKVGARLDVCVHLPLC
jgi:hypothetical protein